MILALLRSKPLIQLTFILLAFARVRGMMTRARKTSCKCFAGATSLGGGPDHILSLLGLLLTMRVHPKMRHGLARLNYKVTT
jgi:hypothetical protein